MSRITLLFLFMGIMSLPIYLQAGSDKELESLLEKSKAMQKANERFQWESAYFSPVDPKIEIDGVRRYLDAGGDPNLHSGNDSFKSSMLYQAIRHEREPVARLLIERGADVNFIAGSRRQGKPTPLHVAALMCQPGMVEFLLAHNADLDFKNEEGKDVANVAKEEATKTLARMKRGFKDDGPSSWTESMERDTNSRCLATYGVIKNWQAGRQFPELLASETKTCRALKSKRSNLTDAARKLLIQGEVLAEEKRYPEAESHFRELIKIAPWHPDARYNLAKLLGAMKRHHQAIIEMSCYVELASNASDIADAKDQMYKWEALRK